MAAESSSTTCHEPKKTKQASQIPLPKEDSQPLPNLPCEIIEEILLRLPVKSLLRLRCICKSWRSLILNPKFVKTHLSLATMNTDYTQHRLLLISPGDDVKSCSLRAVLHENSDTAVEIDCPNRPILVVGCCDGLVCMEIKRRVFLWNPSTREFMTLPFVEMSYPYYFPWYGFAYDESIDDYKVVVIFKSSSGCEVQVYTLRSGSWRRIGDFPHCVLPDGMGTFVNRALHWANESNDNIVSLDLAKETYGEVLEPEYGDDCLHEIVLEVLNGCLCIVRYCDSNACADVWIMKEYGIKESWTKLFVIPSMSHPSERLLCILKNGEVLLRIQKQLVWYSPKDGTFSHLTVHNCLACCCQSKKNCSACLSAYLYVESLVSPHIDADSADRCQHQY